MSMFWDHSAFGLPVGSVCVQQPDRSTQATGVEHPNCDADDLEQPKDTNLCLKSRSHFAGHLAAERSPAQVLLDWHHSSRLSLTLLTVLFCCLHFKLAFSAGKLPFYHYISRDWIHWYGQFFKNWSTVDLQCCAHLLHSIVTQFYTCAQYIWEHRDSFPENYFFVSKRSPSLWKTHFQDDLFSKMYGDILL